MLFNNRKRKWIPLCVILLATVGGSCYYDKEELLYPGNAAPSDCGTTPASFSADVLPLITSKCAVPGCHDATASGGFTFTNYTQISSAKEAISMEAVIQKAMPPTGPLPTSETNILKCWIAGGGLNN